MGEARPPVFHDTGARADLWLSGGVLLALNLLALGVYREAWAERPDIFWATLGADGIALAFLLRAIRHHIRRTPLLAIRPEGLWTRDNGLLAWRDILDITVEAIRDEDDGRPNGRVLCITLTRRLNGPISSLFSTHPSSLWVREERFAMPLEVILATIKSNRPWSPP